TRENREMDIQNYITYLDSVFDNELKKFPNLPVTLVGFSQGSATVTRWVTHGKLQFDRLILWAGLFPPDMDFVAGHEKLKTKTTFMVVGKDDPYLNADRMKEFDQLASKIGIQPEKIYFEGKHEIKEDVLTRFI
ncbi:MAG TPA: alpha/beta hydrolase, partial [Cyclobacteriaceae bacterium]|nr:alpha/beta hydrolase [Cyclobacteriaceae bacterium]